MAKSKRRRWEVISICSLLVLMVFAVFGQTLHHGFLNFDDDVYVYENPAVNKGLTLQSVGWAFTRAYSCNWHPLTMIFHMLDCQLYGLWAGGHHLTNVLLHSVAAVLLFLMLREMTGAPWRSAFVAAVFAIHPLRVESVAWVAERKDVLSGLFFMLTLWAYARYARPQESRGRYTTVVVWFALGLMSKPMLVTIPFVLLMLDYWPLGRLQHSWQLPRLVKEKLPLFALSALSCLATIIAQKEAIQPWERFPLSLRVENALVAYNVYLGKLIYPANLAVLYPMAKHGWPTWQMMAAIVLLGALSAWAFLLRRNQPFLVVGWLWYLGMLVPVIGILQVGAQSYADRYTYLPQIGLCFAGTWALAEWAGEWRRYRVALGGVAVLVLCLLLVAAYHQTSLWRDNKTLWTHALGCTQDNSPAHNNLGDVLLRQGRTEEAVAQFREALRLNPANSKAHSNLGNALLDQGRPEEAIAQFREALRLNPAYTEAHSNLGNALVRQGRTEEAVAQFREALRLNPALAEANSNLGIALLRQGRTEEAIAQFHVALRLNPALAKTHYNLGNAVLQLGRTEEAIAQFHEALRLNPALANAQYTLGNLLFGQGRMEEAIAHYREALRLNPAYTEAHNNLGASLLRQGRTEEAIAHYREALRLNPALGNAHNNLGNALFQQGRVDEAIEHLQKAIELQPANAAIQNSLAWILATAPQASLRSGIRAVQLATQASQSSGGDNPIILRTLAAAYAEVRDFSNALQTAQSALQLAETQSNTDLALKLRREIKLYEAGQPYREGL